MTCHDPLTGIPDERVRPDLGEGIVRRAPCPTRATPSCAAGSVVTPAVLALAAARGHDDVDVVRTPVVGHARARRRTCSIAACPVTAASATPSAHAVPAFVGALGARGNPAVRAPDTDELLLREIEDAAVDVLVTTGSTAPGPDNHLRSVLRDLNARWLVDGVSVTPGAQMLLARLPDGRFLVGLPGDPRRRWPGSSRSPAPSSAPCATIRWSVTGGPPCSWTTRRPPTTPTTPRLVPVLLEVSAAATQAGRCPRPGRPASTDGRAPHAIAVVPPGAGLRGDVVELLDPYGRELWT